MRPARPTETPLPAPAAADAQPVVLVVDDQAPTRNILIIALEGMGFRTLAAASAESALDLLAEIQPVLIVCDIRLPGMDGVTFTDHVHARIDSDIPVMLLSAYGRPRRHHADAFLAKPFRLEAFEAAIESLVSSAA